MTILFILLKRSSIFPEAVYWCFLKKQGFLQYLNQFDLQMFDLRAAFQEEGKPEIIQNKGGGAAILKVSFT